MLKYSALTLFLFTLFSSPTHAQYQEMQMDTTYVDTSFFAVKLGGGINYYTPMKYGAEVQLFIGKRHNYGIMSIPHSSDRDYNGIALGAGLYRGGYHFGIYYYDLSAWVGPAGKKIGLVYLNTNNYSSVVKRSELLGLQADFLLGLLDFKLGIMKEMDSNQMIPTLGIGIPVGPKLWYDE